MRFGDGDGLKMGHKKLESVTWKGNNKHHDDKHETQIERKNLILLYKYPPSPPPVQVRYRNLYTQVHLSDEPTHFKKPKP